MTKDYYNKYREIERNKSDMFQDPFIFLTGVRQATNALNPCLKCEKAIDIIKEGKRTLVYSAFLTYGVKKLQEMLKDSRIKFVEITGSMSQKERLKAVEQYNSGKVDVFFITKAGGEGLDLKGTRYVILLEKSWNRPTEEQIIGRAARYKSHTHLPKSEQRVDVYHLLIAKPENGRDADDKKKESADELLARYTEEKETKNRNFLSLLHAAAINARKGSKCPPGNFKPMTPKKEKGASKTKLYKILITVRLRNIDTSKVVDLLDTKTDNLTKTKLTYKIIVARDTQTLAEQAAKKIVAEINQSNKHQLVKQTSCVPGLKKIWIR
jgi:superfamily II DNA/RNA helicase